MDAVIETSIKLLDLIAAEQPVYPPDQQIADEIRTCADVIRAAQAKGQPAVVPAETLSQLSELKSFAHDKLYEEDFKDVEESWRVLFSDVLSLHALAVLFSRPRDQEEDAWLDEFISLLDVGGIMSGGPKGRKAAIDAVFSELDRWYSSHKLSPEAEFVRITDDSALIRQDHWPIPDHKVSKLVVEYPIERRSRCSLEAFQAHLARTGDNGPLPLVLNGSISHWPAIANKTWQRPTYFFSRTLGGRRMIPVETGRSYVDEGWGQQIITFRKFFEEYIVKQVQMHSSTRAMGYLAQYDLFTQISSLRSDVCIPDFVYAEPPPPLPDHPLHAKYQANEVSKLEEPQMNAWIGPAGTISPLHTDPYHNILCQVVGRKYVRLYGPVETPRLYPRGTDKLGIDMSNTSKADIGLDLIREDSAGSDQFHGNAELARRWDSRRLREEQEKNFPLLQDAQYVETILEEGDSLYIPVGWWHYIESLSTSMSVSFWWN